MLYGTPLSQFSLKIILYDAHAFAMKPHCGGLHVKSMRGKLVKDFHEPQIA